MVVSMFRNWRRGRVPKILAVFTLVSMVVVLLWYRGRAAPGSDGGGVKLPKEIHYPRALDSGRGIKKLKYLNNLLRHQIEKENKINNSINNESAKKNDTEANRALNMRSKGHKGGVARSGGDKDKGDVSNFHFRSNMAGGSRYSNRSKAVDTQNSLRSDKLRFRGAGMKRGQGRARDPSPLNRIVDKMVAVEGGKDGDDLSQLIEKVGRDKYKHAQREAEKKETEDPEARNALIRKKKKRRPRLPKGNVLSEHAQSNPGGILGSFDAERYLSEQRMTEGQGNKMKKFQFNQVISDATSPDRRLDDYRHPLCKNSQDQYLPDLPRTSVIICFTNEARSALLRTIVSVLNRSPPEYLDEILLVDDYSDNAMDGSLLADIPKVRVIRMPSRSGLIRSRIRGSQEAVGPVLLFLDSHCEVVIGWLEPLLSRIKTDRTIIASPVIDIIDKDTMAYTVASPSVRGGFDISLNFKWDFIPQEKLHTGGNAIQPIRTPAIAGGLFAIDKEWFHHIGEYDDKMDIWGGENVELSMRAWRCGGSMEILPCSHVGHIFRNSLPYSFGPGGSYQNTVLKNIRRTVEVWLDEYKTYFYEKNPSSLRIEYGDISERVALKEHLQCKSISWYINNVYREFEVPPVEDFRYGLLTLHSGVGGVGGAAGGGGGGGGGAGGAGGAAGAGAGDHMCLDSAVSYHNSVVEVRKCSQEFKGLEDTQSWALLSHGGIKHASLCLTISLNTIVLTSCSVETNAAQEFSLLSNGLIWHKPSKRCLTFQSSSSSSFPVMAECDRHDSNPDVTWQFLVP